MLVHTPQVAVTASRTWELDLRNLPHSQRNGVVFERLDNLGPDDRIVVICESEPRTLRWQIEAWWPDRFEWTWTETGPLAWRTEITRCS